MRFIIKSSICVILAAAAFFAALGLYKINAENKAKEAQISAVSTLEDIIKTSELSTFTAVYDGIAEVKSTADPEKTDYYVSYEAKIKAGIDFENVKVEQDENNIVIIIPSAEILETPVDISSLDYIFMNNSSNTSSVSEEAYKACEADIAAETKDNEEILKLARENAENILTALTKPVTDFLGSDFNVVFKWEGDER